MTEIRNQDVRGFRALDPERQRHIASRGGQASGGARPVQRDEDKRLRNNSDHERRSLIGHKGGQARGDRDPSPEG